MAKRTGVDLDDLDDLRRDLRAARAGLPQAIDGASREVARIIAVEARDRADSLGSTAAHVAPSIREDGTTVGLGGSAYPMAPGAEFGGRGRPTTQQFEPYRADGYFLYPAVRATEDQTDAIYLDHVEDHLRRHDLA